MLSAFRKSTPPVIENASEVYTMPSEDGEMHEGTWLQWPHNHGYDKKHIERYESSWVEMTRELHKGEMVHIIAYDSRERTRISALLKTQGIDMSKTSFLIAKTDDVWVRDNGPIFVRDPLQNLHILNWKFNGWGKKADYKLCNEIPVLVSKATGIPHLSIAMVNEGGSVELDGRGTLMAKRSSILNRNRNPNFKQANVEAYFGKYLGVTNFIWLNGVKGIDITDDHIDGTARFANGDTIVTFHPSDSDTKEYKLLSNAKDARGKPYSIVHLPLTKKKPPGMKYRGTYVNFYVANDVVLVPKYNDTNDEIARGIIQSLYPTRRVVGIDATELAKDGGMVHCVTQQQPLHI